MAILLFAAPVAGLRGKVGGNIFSANRSGPYLKAWGRGSNPRTQNQTNHRAALIQFSKDWQSLTAGERTGWNTYAALPAQDKTNSLGETFSASGFNWFVEINLNLLAAGDAQRTAAPTIAAPAAPTVNRLDFTANPGGENLNMRLLLSDPQLGLKHAIFCEILPSPGRTAQAEIRKFMLTRLPVGGTANFAFTSQAIARFGTLQEGQNAFCLIRAQTTEGRRGPPSTASKVAT